MATEAKIYGIHDAKSGLSRIVDRASAGEEIILSKNGVPCAQIGPLKTDERDLGFVKGRAEGDLAFSDNNEEIGYWLDS